MQGVIFANLAAAAATVVILFLRRFFKDKLFAKVFVLLWAAVVLRLLLPFEFSSAVSIYPLPEKPQNSYYVQNTYFESEKTEPVLFEENEEAFEEEPAVSSPQKTKAKISSDDAFFAIWVTGAFCLFAFFTAKHFCAVKKITADCAPFDELPEGFVPAKNVRIYKSKNLCSPLSFGFLRPKIIIPEGTSKEQLPFVLLHENTHVKDRDAVLKFFALLALCLNWFDPFVWVAVKYLDRDMERYCDERVLSSLCGEKASSYAGTILDFAEKESLSLSYFSAASLTERIVSIMNNKNKKSRFPAVLCVFAAVIITMSACGTVPKEPNNNSAPAETTVFSLEMSFAGLEHGNTKFLKDTVEVMTDNVVFEYQLTYASPTITLEVGLLSDDGTEYSAAVADGNGEGKIKNIPAGTYRLFIRNTGCIDLPEGKTVEGGAVVGKIISPAVEIENIVDYLKQAEEKTRASSIFVDTENGNLVAVVPINNSLYYPFDGNNIEKIVIKDLGIPTDSSFEITCIKSHDNSICANRYDKLVNAGLEIKNENGTITISVNEPFGYPDEDFGIDIFADLENIEVISEVQPINYFGVPNSAENSEKIDFSDIPYIADKTPVEIRDENNREEAKKSTISFTWPCEENEITCAFGSLENHAGIDIGHENGSEIYAAADGEVFFVSDDENEYGACLSIDHGEQFSSFYAHCSEICVEQGDKVKAGDLIAKTGSSGNSTGPHLHFELRKGKTQLDPEDFLPVPAVYESDFEELSFAEKAEIAMEFIRPIEGGYVSCSLWEYKGHLGADYTPAEGEGSDILAVADGKVVKAKWGHTGYGNCIILDHGDGIQTLYAHCHELFVELGDEVKAGDVIASVGSSGNSTGTHLHFELRQNGTYVDPEKYIPEA